jgi:hypothetical protein
MKSAPASLRLQLSDSNRKLSPNECSRTRLLRAADARLQDGKQLGAQSPLTAEERSSVGTSERLLWREHIPKSPESAAEFDSIGFQKISHALFVAQCELIDNRIPPIN